jgi:hypothetical protein
LAGRKKQGETYTSSGICHDGKSPAFGAAQGELHATNADTGMCRLDRSEARCRSVAAKAQKVFLEALRCAVRASRKPWVTIELRYPASLKPRVAVRGHPRNACVTPWVTRRTHAFDPGMDLRRPDKWQPDPTSVKPERVLPYR